MGLIPFLSPISIVQQSVSHGFISLTHRCPARPLGNGLHRRLAPRGQVRIELEDAPGPGCDRQERAPALHWQHPYPKVGARLMLVPRQFALAPTNNGLPFGYWRYSRHTALFMKVFLGVFIMHVLAAKANFGTQYNVSWRGGDSVLYGNAGKALKEEMELADKLGKMYK